MADSGSDGVLLVYLYHGPPTPINDRRSDGYRRSKISQLCCSTSYRAHYFPQSDLILRES